MAALQLADIKQLLDAMENRIKARFESHERRFDIIDRHFDTIDQRFDTIDRRFESINERFGAIDRRFDAIDRRFDGVDGRLDGLQQMIEEGFAGVGEAIETIHGELARHEARLEGHDRALKALNPAFRPEM